MNVYVAPILHLYNRKIFKSCSQILIEPLSDQILDSKFKFISLVLALIAKVTIKQYN